VIGQLLGPVAELGSNGHGLLRRPPEFQAEINGRALDTSAPLPLGGSQRQSECRYQAVVRSVVLLLTHGGPTAILGAVGAVWVNTVKRVPARRLAAHVRQKVLKLLPSLAHPNAAPTVVAKLLAIGIGRPELDAEPRPMFWGAGLPMGCVAQPALNRLQFSDVATAGFAFARSQVLRIHDRFFPAVAQTTPHGVLMLIGGGALKHRKTAKLLRGQVYEGGHAPYVVNAILDCKR
jgi:hypothetical protein